MALFQYAKATGGLSKSFEAPDADTALKSLSTFTDVAKGSGVMAVPPSTAPSAISSPTPAPRSTGAPAFPPPTAPAIQDSFFTSLTGQVEQTRGAVESAYKSQLDDIDRRREDAQKRVDELTEKQEVLLETDVEPTLKPFREQLENSERERLHINENFEANQSLIRELETLLTEGNDLIARRKTEPVAQQVLNRRVSKTMEDVAARAGVVQAVLVARSGQIAEAQRLIDRSVTAITADRTDQLSYYSTLLEFYENQRDEAGNRVLNLDTKQQEFIKAQIGLLEGDLTRAELTADTIRNAMVDPDTAQAYAQAGVTLNDTPEQIGEKLGEYAYAREVSDTSNEMALSGYTFLTPGQAAPAGADVSTIIDSRGKQKRYYKAQDTSDSHEDVIDSWARRINSGTDKISSVPNNIRNQVVARTRDFAQEDLDEDIDAGLEQEMEAETLIPQLEAAYPEFSKAEIEAAVESAVSGRPTKEPSPDVFSSVGSFFSSLFR